MSGIRINRLLASTAVLLFLTAAPGAALAEDGTPSNIVASPANTAVPADATPKSEPPAATAVAPTPAAPAPVAAAPAAAAPATAAPAATAAAPAETPAPTAAATAATTPTDPVADQLHNLTAGKFDQIIGNKQVRAQIDAFYSGRNYAPIWTTDGKANARGTAAIAYLGQVDADGLNPTDYPVPNFAAISDPAALANAEIQLTASVLTYAHHAAVGRVHWSRVSPDIEFNEKPPEAADVLAGIVGANDVAAVLDAYEPQTPGYKALKAKYAEIRGGKIEKQADKIGSGPVLKTGMQDDRIPALRERLNVLGDGSTTYDKALADAVKKFQQERQLPATGTLTAATVEALNGKTPDHANDIILANLERWRWMPHHLPDTYVMVNLPDFTLRVMHNDQLVWTTRVVIGKPDMPTPIMTAEMKYITVNPTWNVPPSIVNREYLPALAQDPTVLDRMGLKVSHNPDGSVHISQPPGDKNALGRLRFNFPNKFLVYQHDTPDKYMFAYDKRALSHGCMRVLNPPHYAEVLLSLVRPNDGYSEDRIKKMIAEGAETDIQFPTFVQVDLTYQTAFVDDEGKLQFRDDVYGRDKALIALLKSNDKLADIAVEHKVDPSHREVLAMPDEPSLFGGNRGLFGGRGTSYSAGGGDNFFSRLFGGFRAEAPPPVPRKPVPHSRKVTRAGDNTVSR
jgi:L,D-transpeptidase YcbB